MESAIIILVFGGFFAVLFYGIAAWKKSRRWYWAFIGFLFGPFALPFVFFAQPYPKTPKEETTTNHEN